MVTIESLLALSALLFVKHLIADGPLQTNYQATHKAVFLHPAGFAHAGTHILATLICFVLWMASASVAIPLAALAAMLVAEFVIHYLVDWSKCWVDKRGAWAEPSVDVDGNTVLVVKNKFFFFAFLTDQTCHSLTYIGLVYWTALVASGS